ncbi:MAG: exodeoxyribonuclease VII small subunit [Candidatus Kapaibacteriota bacterium]
MEETFEAKLKRLQEIVTLLDQSSVSLDESIKLYEEGMELAVQLRKILDEADLKIIQLNSKYKDQLETKASDNSNN